MSKAAMAEVARLYYVRDLTQQDIAERLGVSRFKVVRLLAQRCRDFGWTGWAALLCLLPYGGMAFTFALAFIPGTDGPNRYGPAPF